MKKLSRIILVVVILIGVLFMQSQVQAGSIIINSPTSTANTIGNTATGTNTLPNNTVNTLNTANNTTTNRTTNNTLNKVNNITNTLPKTGIEDSPAGIAMIIGIISAIYAYKKIRDYNI